MNDEIKTPEVEESTKIEEEKLPEATDSET